MVEIICLDNRISLLVTLEVGESILAKQNSCISLKAMNKFFKECYLLNDKLDNLNKKEANQKMLPFIPLADANSCSITEL